MMLLVGYTFLTCLNLFLNFVFIGQLVDSRLEYLYVLLNLRDRLTHSFRYFFHILKAVLLAALNEIVEILLGPIAVSCRK